MKPNSIDFRASVRIFVTKTRDLIPTTIHKIILSALLLSLLPGIVPGAQHVTTDPSGVTIEYSPEFDAPWTDAKGNLQISVQNGTFDKFPGQPEQPVYYMTVAVPPGSNPTMRVTSWEAAGQVQGVFATHSADHDGMNSDQISGMESAPDKLEVHSLLGLATIRVPIYPTRISTGSNRVTLARKVSTRIDFHASKKVSNIAPARINRLHQILVVNADQASSWGKYKTSNLELKSWPQGYLYRFNIEEEGIFKFTFEDLINNGVQLDSRGVPSDQLKVFGNGGTELPLSPGSNAPVGLNECPIFVSDGNDGKFGPGDWFIFYGRGAGGFILDSDAGVTYSLNHYTLKNTYWLNIDPAGEGSRMGEFAENFAANDTITVGTSAVHFELDKFIYGGTSFPGAGRDWYGYTFDGISRIAYNLNLPAAHPDYSAILKFRIVKATSGADPYIKISINGIAIDSSSRSEYYYAAAVQQRSIPDRVLHPGNNIVTFEQTRSNAADALLDWFEVVYKGNLNSTLTFLTDPSLGTPKVIKNTLADPWLFDISDPADVRIERGSSTIRAVSASNKRYLITQPGDFRRVTVRFQSYFPPEEDITDLYSANNRADLLMIIPDNFYDAVEPLYDHYTRRDPPLNASRIRLSEVYNKFSGGLRDPAAIRNLLHYAKDTWAVAPQFVLMCGDGDYNYRDLDRSSNPDMLPPFEGGYEKSVLCSDDWFVDFTDGARDLLPEMSIGRLTAQSYYELQSIAEKIVSYDEEPVYGLWKNRITLAADDETSESSGYEYEHVEFSEQLARSVLPGYIDKVKVYETEYQRQSGREKPLATAALLSSINDGTLIVNYMGHGNPTLWAHERLFVLSRDFKKIEPSRLLPLYIAFTCDWAYWDDPGAQSFPEQLLAEAEGGAIAAIASTRLTYSPPNQTLSQNFYTNLFANTDLSIGEALFLSKHQGWSSTSPTYHLLGDPSLRLAIPKTRGKFTSLTPFPFPALARANVSGEALHSNGSRNNALNGQVIYTLRDSSIPKQYVIGVDESAYTLNYVLPGALAYRGFLSLVDGAFQGDFIIPRDVTLGGSNGKAVAYYYNDETDGIAFIDTVKYAASAVAGIDTIPPVINLFFDHRGYRQGDEVSPEPIVIIEVSDSSGINMTSAMGHGIWLTIGESKPINLTKSFRYQLDSYQQGSLEQRLDHLEPGRYPVKAEAWDSYNNLAVITSEINVVDAAGGLVVDRVLNWPNPFHETTALTFSINKPADFSIKVFTVGGRMIRQFDGHADHNGLVTNISWDGRDTHGARVGNGVYLYKVNAWDGNGGKADGLGRIAFIR